MSEQHRAGGSDEARVRDAIGAAFAENAAPTDEALERISAGAHARAEGVAGEPAGASGYPRRRPRLRTPAIVAAAVVAVALVAVVVAQLAAPWDSRILDRAAAAAAGWRQPGKITHFVQEIAFADPEGTGPTLKERREVWASYDATQSRELRTNSGTVTVEGSIFDVTGPINPVSNEASTTSIWNDRYSAAIADTPQGLAITVEPPRSQSWAHLAADPCQLCHREGVDSRAQAKRLGNMPGYLAAIESGEMKVVGKGEIDGTPTYLLRSEEQLEDGVTEVTLVDIDREEYRAIRYRVERVERVRQGGLFSRSRAIRRVEVDTRILSHELVDPKDLPADWFELQTPRDRPYALRQSFAPAQTVDWPPASPGRTTLWVRMTQPVYDLGESFRIGETLITGVYSAPTPPDGTPGSALATGVPPVHYERMQPVAVVEVWPESRNGESVRTIAEYSEVTSAGTPPRWPSDNAMEYDNVGITPVIWVITVPWGGSAWGIADNGSLIVKKPDATIVLKGAPGARLPRSVLEEAAKHLRRRQ